MLTAIGTTAYYSAGKKCTGPNIVKLVKLANTANTLLKMEEVVGCVNNKKQQSQKLEQRVGNNFKKNNMANFNADDLKNKDYSPTVDGGDNPKYIGVLDRIKVDKSEEYEVVYFCNKFLESYKIPQTKESFQKVERLLRHTDLENEDNRQKLIIWIAENWSVK